MQRTSEDDGQLELPRSRTGSRRTVYLSRDTSLSSQPIDPVDNRNWKLIFFRWALLLSFIACFCCNISDLLYHGKMISWYWEYHGAEFLKFEVIVFISSLVIVPLLVIGIIIILKQNIIHLRRYLTLLFVSSWEQMLLILTLTQLFPHVRMVHDKWQKQEGIGEYEIRFKCCGLFGPDDYQKTQKGRLPGSCFVNPDDKMSKELYSTGCLCQFDPRASFFRIELTTTVFQFILVILLVLHYYYLKRIKAVVRTFRELRRDRIFL